MTTSPEHALERLWEATGGDLERFGPLVAAFGKSSRATLDALRAAVCSDDREAVARLAHRLKGSSPLYGAVELAAQARDLEHAARRSEPLDGRLDGMSRAVDLAIERIELVIARLAATP